jgi:hypothetical protein
MTASLFLWSYVPEQVIASNQLQNLSGFEQPLYLSSNLFYFWTLLWVLDHIKKLCDLKKINLHFIEFYICSKIIEHRNDICVWYTQFYSILLRRTLYDRIYHFYKKSCKRWFWHFVLTYKLLKIILIIIYGIWKILSCFRVHFSPTPVHLFLYVLWSCVFVWRKIHILHHIILQLYHCY